MTCISNLLSLPHDTLVVASFFLDGSDKSSFSSTCKTFEKAVSDQFEYDHSLISKDDTITSFDTFQRIPPNSCQFVHRLWLGYMEQLRHLVRSKQGQRLVRKAFRLKGNHERRYSLPMYSIENIKKLELEVFPKLRAQNALNRWKFWRRVIQNEAFDDVRNQISDALNKSEDLCDSEKGASFFIFMTDLLAKHPEIALQIKMLNLSNANLSEIPACISLFENLESLDLSRNRISVVHPEIGKLKNLKKILLNDNKIKALPPEIGELTKLEHLEINKNQLKAIPPEIKRLVKLQSLFAEYNKIKAIPMEIENLKELQYLFIRNNKLKVIPEALSKCEELEGLFLIGNPIEDIHASVWEIDTLKIVRLCNVGCKCNKLCRTFAIPKESQHLVKLAHYCMAR